MKKIILFILINIAFSESQYIISVSIKGNNSVESSKLFKIINTKNPKLFFKDIFDNRKLYLDKINIKNHYISRGYLEVDVQFFIEKDEKSNINVTFNIDEGIQYKLKTIDIYGNYMFSKKDLINDIGIKNHDIFNPIKLNKSLKNIKNKYLDRGKAMINIVDEVFKENGFIKIRINISEGNTFHIGKIQINTNESINENHIYRELIFATGDIYNYTNILNSQRRIYTSNIFSSVEIKKSINKETKLVNIIIKIRQGDSGNISGEIGFGQTLSALGDDASPISILQGGGRWNISKIRNTGIKLGISSNIGIRLDGNISISTKKIEFSLFSPWIYKLRLPINIKYYFEESTEQGFLSRHGIRTSFLYKQGNQYKLNAIINIENNKGNENNKIEQERSVEINYMYYTLNNFLNPTLGKYFSIKSDLRGTILGGARNYYKIESEYKQFFPIYDYAIFAIRTKTGYIYDFSYSNTISFLPIYDRLYLGGSTSLRAWNEGDLNQIGGYLKQLINLEVRIPLFGLVGSNLFFDAGKIVNEFTTNNKEFDWDIGYGITIMSPIGPLRIDIAYKYGYGKPNISNALLFIF